MTTPITWRLALRAELQCLREGARVARRGAWYLGVVVKLYLLVLTGFRKSRPMRMGFLFLQRIDDLCDGDLAAPSGDSPDDAARSLAELLLKPESADQTEWCGALSAVLRYDLYKLAARAVWHPNEVEDRLDNVIHVMIVDYERRTSQALWPAQQIESQLAQTFGSSLDLMLLAGRSKMRSSDLKSLVSALGWCSVVRDLHEDMERGLCNIPEDVVARAGGFDRDKLTALTSSEPVLAWWESERLRASDLLAAVPGEIERAEGADRSGSRIARMFATSVHKWEKRARCGPPSA